MAMTDSTGSTWRYRWAHRQNERRLRTFHAADEAWRRRDDELRRLRTLAASFHGSAEAGVGLPMELAPGEVVFWTLPAAQLVEVRHTAVLPAPELTVEPDPPELRPRRPEGVRAVDAGLAVLTNRRLVLLGGRGRRDWAYGRMTGLSHDPGAPVTLLQVLDRRRTSGLMVPTGAVADFRFKLTLAFADAIEQRAAVVAQLDELIEEHAAARPVRPAIATPRQARLAAFVGPRAVAVGAALALIVPAMLFESDPPGRTGGSELAAAATPAATPTPTPLVIAPAVRVEPTAAPKPRHTTPAPTSSRAPRPAVVERRCGAPANPFGYDFCGGSRVRKPARGVCDWFDCVPRFWSGRGWLVQCRDGTVSLTGGQRDSCAGHRGYRRTVWS
ncbi:hypothetical protein ONA91_25410 [Micromonospora sp. DR5-3]|uniref:hypothetical protein n=1 Tax=unclassified Micromonospora TaxID=2617518 RepID=UPI0011D992D0|nr:MULTISPECIES: hypothetical protein [unclassified Micromonospora]MCW3817793.1 hypothetical protein [Micromonospora sp. DR5-3]TYC21958.1 hypothetical protein FXF52_23360 [Micromonospora sp. MP36]